MRSIAIVLLALTATARADREPVISIGAVAATRSYANQSNDPESALGGRITLAFEDAPIAIPPPTFSTRETRLVPELLAGFLADDRRAEGFVGAGVRAELQLARNALAPYPFKMRMAIYTAARAEIVGKHQDPAVELALGEYILLRGATRFGWEGALGLRRVDGGESGRSPQLTGLLSIYVGWSL